jgi:hypothetical protein
MPPTRHRRFLQFSLSTLLLLTLGAALWVNYYLMPLKRKHDAVQALRDLGASIRYESSASGPLLETAENKGPPLLRWLIGDEYFSNEPVVIDLGLTRRAVMDDDLAQLNELTDVEELTIDWLTMNEHVGGTWTSYVQIGCKDVTNDGLQHLSHLRNLRWLVLSVYGASVTDSGLEHLKHLKSLKFFVLSGSHVTDAGVDALQKALPNAIIIHNK